MVAARSIDVLSAEVKRLRMRPQGLAAAAGEQLVRPAVRQVPRVAPAAWAPVQPFQLLLADGSCVPPARWTLV